MKKIIILGILSLLATACGSSATSTSSSNTSNSNSALSPIQITEWGVQFTPVSSISDLRYAIDPNHTDTANFSSASLISLDQQSGGSGCATANAPLGTLSRVGDFSAFTSTGRSVPKYVQVGTYYYYYSPQQGSCSTNLAVQNLQTLQAQDMNSALNSLKASTK